jgi:hypothetical protein
MVIAPAATASLWIWIGRDWTAKKARMKTKVDWTMVRVASQPGARTGQVWRMGMPDFSANCARDERKV